MDYHIWWTTLLLIGSFQISENKEILDFLVVYRPSFDEYNTLAFGKTIKEYHRWGPAKEMLLKSEDDYIDSVGGMVPLNCAPATVSCEWRLSGEWNLVNVNTTADQNFTINVGDEVEEEKSGCSKYVCASILFENERPKCFCPANKTIHHITSTEGFSVGPEYQVIRTPSFLIHKGHMRKKWLVVPPKNATTFITVSAQYYQGQYPGVIVQAVTGHNQKKIILNKHGGFSETKQSNNLLEVFRYEGGASSISISFGRQHLALDASHGSLSYDIFPASDRICVSVVYTSPKTNGDVKFNIMLSNGTKYEVSNYTERQFGDWKMRTFKSSFEKMANVKVTLLLDVSGKGTILHSIFGCNPYGQSDVIVVEKAVTIPEMKAQKQSFEDLSGKCLNGGVYNGQADVCICPEGFTGDRCEEGCGPHYFGRNCSNDCSNFDTGCRGMIFCKKYMSCRCATGFHGKFCEKDCDPGYYGASCAQTCGNCKGHYCNRFTGYCHDGCQPGFRRPFCQIPYHYSRISPTVTYQDINVVTVKIDADDVEGAGESKYYQIQYKKDKEFVWTELQPQKLRDTSITTNISDLLPGVNYNVRVIYIDKDGNSYQQSEVPMTSFTSLCTVPTSVNYNFRAKPVSSSIELNWKYDTNKTDCPVLGYTIELQRNWNKVQHNVSGYRQDFTFVQLLPGVSYEVKIKANTTFGEGPFSSPLSVKMSDEAPLHVSNLQITKEESRKLRLSWKPPRYTGGTLQNFLVKYKCTRLLACEGSWTENAREISVPANQNYADLEDLRPHARYFIEVAARSAILGPYTSIEAITEDSAPDSAPEMSETPIVTSTNVSISVQWLPLENCTFLNGYLVGYGYTLFSENRTVLATGNTTNTHIAFDDLTPQTSYFIHTHAVSTGGWSKDKELIINASTAATVPDKVQNLSIYKRGRRVIGVRWAQPLNAYGELESFSVSYCQLNGCKNAVIVRVPPAPCVPWPALFCHSISGLIPNTQYSISVRARNVVVNEYGEAATIYAVTSEGVPEAPTSLIMSSRSSDSVTLEWEPPHMFNGILRSYLINVEQLDSANSSNCCVYSPLEEVPVKSEEGKYKHEVTDLMPASKYIIGVSAKTISIGPSAFLTISTSPEIPELMQAPKLLENNRVQLPLGEGFPGINGTYVLLVLLPNGNSTSVIWNSEIDEKLKNLVTTNSFYAVEEYNAEDMKSLLEEETEFLEVEIGKGMGPRNGTIGVLVDPPLPSSFSVGLALVLDYNGAVSVGFVSAKEVVKNDIEPEDY